MLKLSQEQREQFARAVTGARGRPGIAGEVAALYGAFEADRVVRQPRCDVSGKCCRFEAHGHRLFLTTIEAAVFADGAEADLVRPIDTWDGTGCPYQRQGLCAAHRARPFGCRVYFCDVSSDDWQHAQYERFQASIRELHERQGVPYLYVEWREALSAIGLAVASPATQAISGRSLPVLG